MVTVLVFTNFTLARKPGTQDLLSKKITLKMENRSMAEVLSQIGKQLDITFTYRTKLLPEQPVVSVNYRNDKLADVLKRLLTPISIKYRIIDKQIVLSSNEVEPNSSATELNLGAGATADIPITGTVTDEKGEKLPGVSVLIKGTQRGTTTDTQGKFSLSIPAKETILIFSYVGFLPQEITIGSRTRIDVVLKGDDKTLDEVVVVGFGTQKKQSVVGSIVQTSTEELKRVGNVTDLKQTLTGNLPGLTTITASGEPGGTASGESATSIFIRGRNTWNGGQPLIMVDGVERNMENIDVNEVATISVLKDASATAVFGVKGANGVILITTKRGSDSKPQLAVSYNTTALSVSRLPEKLDSYEAIMLRNEMIEREGPINPVSWGDYVPYEVALRYRKPQSDINSILYPNVDWKEAMFKDVSWSHKANLNVTGGTKFVKYFGSLAYLHESDMFKKYENYKNYDPSYSFNRFNFRSNLDFRVTGTTTLKMNLAGYYSQKNTNYSFASGSSGTNPLAWAAAYRFPPDVILPQYADGSWGQNYSLPPEALQNPVALIYNTGVWQRREVTLNTDFALEQKLDFITKGLSITGLLFYDNSLQTVGGITDQNHVRPEGNLLGKIVYPDRYTGEGQDPSQYTETTPVIAANAFDWVPSQWTINPEEVSSTFTGYLPIRRRLMYQLQSNYTRSFDKHNVGAMGLFKREQFAQGSMFPSYREDWVFRTTYDYDSRYLFEFNGAYNGSEKFGPGYRFDFFPSYAFGWNVTNEKFFKVSWINHLKFRYSAGTVGDDAGGARWAYQSQYTYGNSSLLNANPNEKSPYIWYKESIVGNPDIHWEKAKKNNYGAELGLFNDLIQLNVDYFTENRTDIIITGTSRAIAPYFGATPPSANGGQVKSKGYELELKVNKRFPTGLNLWGNFSHTHTQNSIINRDDPALQVAYQKQAGYQIGQTRSLVNTGFYNNWDEVFSSVPQQTNDLSKLPGYYNTLDYNADGVITSNDDAVPFGHSDVPQNNYNASIGASYKGFSVMVQFFAVNNVSRYIPLDNFYLYQNVLFSHVRDYWSKDNPDATSFLPRWKSPGQFIGNYFIYDGSFVRLRTAEVAYSFPKTVASRLGLGSLRLFVNGNNLLFWSNLPDDRESAASGGAANAGAYPTPRRINFGIDLTF
ncbi:SusC/RagA family TonB-linked outer membrane protein [Spirosoma aureum]|uniref:SusC/RagA family TonB-linked outer membrane protein n=1 Tax=Spirosoma aureum TaxID=2692134 RepID=A0A6G9ANA2_9BACT|nr:TonB-dependent receptor [Spirosoma aureum]QIP13683.1 SusC/RagA family TonB-linked outer membrane protein [Spirosoma aureum]